jgi:hypothetical protein
MQSGDRCCPQQTPATQAMNSRSYRDSIGSHRGEVTKVATTTAAMAPIDGDGGGQAGTDPESWSRRNRRDRVGRAGFFTSGQENVAGNRVVGQPVPFNSTLVGNAIFPLCVLRSLAFARMQENQTKTQMGNTQDVTGLEKSVHDAPAVDPRSVGAAEVANDDCAVADGEAAVATGYPRRVKADLARSIPADECQQLSETEVSVPVQRDEAREHDQSR